MQDNGDGQGRDSSNSLQFKRRLKILHGMAERQQRKRRLKLSRWNRRKWMHAALFTSLGIMVATIVPGFSSAMRQTDPGHSLATLPLQLPSVEETLPQESFHDNWQSIRIRAGQTVSALFKEYDLPQSSLHALMGDKDTRAALTKLRPGNEIALNLSNAGDLRGLRYDRDPTHRVELVLDGDKLTENVIERETSTRTVVISGEVGRSLFHSARKLGLTGGNINALTDDIFKYDIDFNEEVAATDRFSVVVEQTWREGELIKSGPIKAATFTARGKLHSAFLFERGSKAEYFTGEGRPLRKSFIRMPISYARLSSNFGARRHPVLGKMRMHKGVDYAATTGTPIMAAGDARVQFAGKQNGYGNVVILDHGKGHTTLYAHMSRFGKIKQGQRVAQGTVIGYVGSTGLATGPHLHYEFRVNGVHRNPLNVTMPPPEPLNGAQMVAFRSYTANALERIRTVENLIYADVDTGKDVAATTTAAKPEKKG